MRGENFYIPMELVDKVKTVKSVNAKFLDHNDPSRPLFVGWSSLLDKYFMSPPSGYTSNYLFEIDNGLCTARNTVDTADGDSITFAMVDPDNVDHIKKAVLMELFGANVGSILEASISGVQLPRHPIKELPAKKVKSLPAKYFSIPKEYLAYYLDVPEAIVNAATPGETAPSNATPNSSTKRKPGRPRKKKAGLKSNQSSILQFFSSAK
ncbi:hypothetical protein PC118_g12652 [Phytophthora cactorum]|uniref:Uncharacterized protein n=1 Tax=Phytophthora cactorum TaxID=29920 RepID=A0A8T1FRQ3_9STRA|nr:hypothetical protein PC111_g14393 [Phytophthora cactorum]KAG2891227.1 hypothetical protein PC114_g17081 [Phytophthora cactorum]KAG2977824.1 hypothetical protein PC118_g12652 [Phytophthora cactorum]KAG3001949.1 hypothetical protein PC119_g16530 [Phytophthora cactorum]KAG3144443.1 hypothetical protein C6341_g18744 [Phytophthora cactorum]